MTVFQSKVSPQSGAYKQNRAEMTALVEKLNALNARAPARSAQRKERFDERGQLLPRERLARLLDPGMPYFEIGNIGARPSWPALVSSMACAAPSSPMTAASKPAP